MRPWLLAAVLMIGLQMLPDRGYEALIYTRDALASGQVWRVWTANFIHLGWNHLWLNLAGFLVIGWLFADEASLPVWIGVLVLCCVASSLGMFWLTPDADRVVGMSGVLHGLFAFGSICWIRSGYRFGWVLLIGMFVKLYWEQSRGAMPFSEEFVGGPVITDAHLWGALGGVACGVVMLIWQRLRPRV